MVAVSSCLQMQWMDDACLVLPWRMAGFGGAHVGLGARSERCDARHKADAQ
jgi:hypothetical protein